MKRTCNLRNLKSENAQAFVQNATSGILDFFNKEAEYNNLMTSATAIMAANPHVTPEYLESVGLPQFKNFNDWLKISEENRLKRKEQRKLKRLERQLDLADKRAIKYDLNYNPFI